MGEAPADEHSDVDTPPFPPGWGKRGPPGVSPPIPVGSISIENLRRMKMVSTNHPLHPSETQHPQKTHRSQFVAHYYNHTYTNTANSLSSLDQAQLGCPEENPIQWAVLDLTFKCLAAWEYVHCAFFRKQCCNIPTLIRFEWTASTHILTTILLCTTGCMPIFLTPSTKSY